MPLSAGEKIRIILKRRNMTITDLAAALGTTQSNISRKINRDNLSESDLSKIAAVLDCTYNIDFTLNDTHETV